MQILCKYSAIWQNMSSLLQTAQIVPVAAATVFGVISHPVTVGIPHIGLKCMPQDPTGGNLPRDLLTLPPPFPHSLCHVCVQMTTKLLQIPPVLWRCWLGSRKGTRPVKNWVVGCWRGYLSMERRADLHMAKLMPLPLTVSCFSKLQIGFTFLVLAYRGSPRQRAVKWVCVCVYLQQ